MTDGTVSTYKIGCVFKYRNRNDKKLNDIVKDESIRSQIEWVLLMLHMYVMLSTTSCVIDVIFVI